MSAAGLFALVWLPCLSVCRSLSLCPSCPLPDSAPVGHFPTPSLHNWTVFLYSVWCDPVPSLVCLLFKFGFLKVTWVSMKASCHPCLISYSPGLILLGLAGGDPWKSPALLEPSSLQDSFPEKPSKQTPVQARTRQKFTGTLLVIFRKSGLPCTPVNVQH